MIYIITHIVAVVAGLAGGYFLRPYVDKDLAWAKAKKENTAKVISLIKDDLSKL